MFAGGPGFFIFFQEDEIQAGGGYSVIIYTKEQKPVEIERETFKKVSKKLRKYKKAKKEVSAETIFNIAESMADTFSAKPTMDRYGVSYQEAISRYKEIVSEIAYIMATDEEEAIILIMANI